MNGLKSIDDLKADLKNGADAEVTMEALKHLLKRVLKEFDDHEDLPIFRSVVIQFGDSR